MKLRPLANSEWEARHPLKRQGLQVESSSPIARQVYRGSQEAGRDCSGRHSANCFTAIYHHPTPKVTIELSLCPLTLSRITSGPNLNQTHTISWLLEAIGGHSINTLKWAS